MTEVLYRKWRPQSFAEVVGQEAVTRTLRNSVAQGRLAHAYLLCGPRGTGKTTLGRLLAKAANCAAPRDGEPCNECESCIAFNEGRAMDFVEQDAASHNSVDDIRQLRENVVLTPMAGSRKVYLLDEVHMLSHAAENALLKTLEEPPPHIVFVLATTDPHKVAATIISRCQRFDLKRIPLGAATARLSEICEREGFALDADSIAEIARATTGSLRDGINALEQVVTYYGRSPTLEQVQEALGLRVDARSGQLARLALAGDLAGGLKLISEVKDDGVDIKTFSRQVVQYLRGLLLAKAGVTEALDLPQEMAAEVRSEALEVTRDEILRALKTFGRIDWRDESAAVGPLPLELALVEFVTAAAPGSAHAAQHVAEPLRQGAAVSAPSRREAATASRPQSAPQMAAVATRGAQGGASAEGARWRVAAETRPAAEGAHEPATTGVKGDLLERVRHLLKDTEKQLSALLNGSCEVRSADGDKVVLGFYHTFHLERMEKGDLTPPLEKAFSQALGREVRVVYEHAPRGPRPDGAPRGGHLVQAARAMGARTVEAGD